uniref:Uncharacterized protein n=1 Tax=Arundo donax TaxID=35708 RepID=A0A0A9BBX7_ARUDO
MRHSLSVVSKSHFIELWSIVLNFFQFVFGIDSKVSPCGIIQLQCQ